MRWKSYPNITVNGQIRHIKRFLLFPRTIGCESRWLELVTITQKYTRTTLPGFSYFNGWNDLCWGKYKTEGENIK